MRVIKYLFLGLMFLGKPVFAQKESINKVLNSVWSLENEKYENYRTFLYFFENKIYRLGLANEKLTQSENFLLWDLNFLSDSTIKIIDEQITDEELATFFNKNPSLLFKDTLIDFRSQIISVNAIHLNKTQDTINYGHVWTYQFYNKQMFSQYGYGWTPGQPQTGYIYNIATNIPKLVLIEIQKINSANFLTIKVTKANIYLNPSKKGKMYLLKGDIVELLEAQKNWLHIRYYGKKVVEGWIKKSDVE